MLKLFSLHSEVTVSVWCHLVTGVEQLESGASCITPDHNLFQLFHTSQITIIMDRAVQKTGCMLIRECMFNRANYPTIPQGQDSTLQ